ncbi:MAG TPA: BamA/TamA family outer membrane protein [Polyangiaceae bacterium]|nr:BamA/TamA family outer membrane protein [Polyangiaceae bacterium]
MAFRLLLAIGCARPCFAASEQSGQSPPAQPASEQPAQPASEQPASEQPPPEPSSPGGAPPPAPDRQTERSALEDSEPALPEKKAKDYPAYVILPAAYYSAEVGLAFLVHNELQFLPEGPRSKSPPSSVTLGVAYSTLNQFLTESKPQFYLDDSRTWLWGTYLFRRYTDRYYGTGNDTPGDYQTFLEYVVHLRSEGARQVLPRLYVGGLHEIKAMLDIEGKAVFDPNDNEIPNGDPLLTAQTPGYSSGLVHGLGGQVFWDSRDSIYYPTRGGYYQTTLTAFLSPLGSDHQFVRWTLDARHFFPLYRKDLILGLQLWHEVRGGDVPFHMLAEFGGAWQMRGYRDGRYRDLHQTVVQAELRFPLFWRFLGVAFVGMGEVYGTSDFAFDLLRVAAGGGVRYRFNDTLFLRMDLARGSETMVIFNGGQAF